MNINIKALVIPLSCLLIGCATSVSSVVKPLKIKITGYPVNQQAERYGVITTQLIDKLQGHVQFSITIDGKTLQGQGFTVDNSYAKFGSAFATVYPDTGGIGYANTAAFVKSSPGSSRGIAAAFGAGLRLECEYIVNNKTLASSGVCITSDGAHFRYFGEVVGLLE